MIQLNYLLVNKLLKNNVIYMNLQLFMDMKMLFNKVKDGL